MPDPTTHPLPFSIVSFSAAVLLFIFSISFFFYTLLPTPTVFEGQRPFPSVIWYRISQYAIGYYLLIVFVCTLYLLFTKELQEEVLRQFPAILVILVYNFVLFTMVLFWIELGRDPCNPRTDDSWSTMAPKTFHGCEYRVAPLQGLLFTEPIYQLQFFKYMTNIYGGNYTPEAACELTTLQEGLLLSVQNNSTLCSQGFEGNSDLYGLGVRVGIYVQWIASFLANNLLPNSKGKLQGAWLLFALALCITTYVSSSAGPVFSL
ncbi:hypothetical protein F5Y08DRAFT_221877 [Xylaria arbuscula]|nr:hypothetical protein F5Y08DRAFT_221877 [Xylaria arbuscula]